MKAIEGDKYVDKICPLFPPIPTKRPIAMQPGPFGGLIELTMTLTTCQKERCQLWYKRNECCALSLLAFGMTLINVEVEGLSNAIKDIVEYAKTLKEKPHGNS